MRPITFNGAKAQITGTGKAIFENLFTPEQVAHLGQVSHELQIRGQIVMPNSEVITTLKISVRIPYFDAFYTKMPLLLLEPEKLATHTRTAAKYIMSR